MTNNQSKIEKLISELCPNGVEFKELVECASIKRGRRVTKSELNPEKKYPVYSGGVTPMGYFEKHNQSANTITVVKYGTAGFVNFITEDFWANDVCYCIKPSEGLENKYLFFVLKSKQDFIQSQATNAIPAHLPTEVIEGIKIPLPPPAIQEEIVKILDSFTELEAELEAELTARGKQYEHYREELLFDEKYQYLTFDKLCTINQGLQVPISDRKTEPGENRFFYITVQFLKNNIENFYIENPKESVVCNEDDILVTRTGSTGKIITGVNGCFHNNFFKLNCNKNVKKRYMYHLLSSKKMYNKMMSSASGGTVPDLPHSSFYKISAPIPPIEEQERIVSILDKFDALVNDISVGLPAELEARRKQYEYYRGKLLTFKYE